MQINIVRAVGTVLAVAATGFVTSAQAADNSVKFGAIVNPIGQVALAEYEYIFAERVSIGARVGSLTYDYEDGSYEEKGDGVGAEFIARFYPRGAGFKGFYVGGGVGIWQTEWDWVDPYDYPYVGDGSSTALDVNVNLGWKIPLGTPKVYLDPSINIGNYFSVSGDDDSELGLYAGGGIAVGFVF